MWTSGLYHQVLAHGFAQSLLVGDAGSVLATATSWDELQIQEEAESGGSVTSTIRLPAQVGRVHREGPVSQAGEETLLCGKQRL